MSIVNPGVFIINAAMALKLIRMKHKLDDDGAMQYVKELIVRSDLEGTIKKMLSGRLPYGDTPFSSDDRFADEEKQLLDCVFLLIVGVETFGSVRIKRDSIGDLINHVMFVAPNIVSMSGEIDQN